MDAQGANRLREWKSWLEQRVERVSAPDGPLALIGTHWLADAKAGALEGVPGLWADEEEELVLTAAAADGITLDGTPVDGALRLVPAQPGLARGEQRLVVMRREGEWAVRIFDPRSERRQAFAGIDAFDYDERWVLPAVFRPYEEHRRVRVPNADGRERGLGLAGELVFAVEGREHRLATAADPDGTLWSVIADGTSGRSTFRFRFVRPPAPDADGRVELDFNRALLPPCAFADHFICPLPPPGNTLPFPVEAGEKGVLRR